MFVLLNFSLTGHTDVAAYALDWSPCDPIVASGGRDRQILLWNVDHYFNSMGRISEEEKELYKDEPMSDEEQMQQSSSSRQNINNEHAVSRIQKSLQSYLTDSKPSKTKVPTL